MICVNILKWKELPLVEGDFARPRSYRSMNNPFNSSDTCQKFKPAAPSLAVITRSEEPGRTSLFWRKNSRIRRFRRFRWTAEPILFPTVIPNLRWSKLLGQMETRKWGLRYLAPSLEILWKSALRQILSSLRKVCRAIFQGLRSQKRIGFQYSLASTISFFLPFALLRFRTKRPPLVDIRFRKPWVLFRRVLLG